MTPAPTHHIVGVGGVGMSAVAHLLRAQGLTVTGSDRETDRGGLTPSLERLVRAGVYLVPQDGSGITTSTTSVIVSTAIEADNPDLATATRLGIPVRHRSEPVADVMAGRLSVAVAGTSGKTTVTGMLGWILEQTGRDPLVVNGGAVLAWRADDRIGNVRWSEHGPAVIEADESDRSFLRFRPDVAVVTNLSADHFRIDETRVLFQEFLSGVRKAVVSPPGLGLPLPPGVQGLDETVQGLDERSEFLFRGHLVRLALPGRHNRENAVLALRTAEALGVDPADAAAALSTFSGIERRLELVGESGGVRVYDDYAHNPAKIAASLRALQELTPAVGAVWRPHGYGPLRAMTDELAEILADVLREEDSLLVLPVYDAGGTADRSVTPAPLVERLQQAGRNARLVATPDEARDRLLTFARPGHILVTMGARDPGLPSLAGELVRRLRS